MTVLEQQKPYKFQLMRTHYPTDTKNISCSIKEKAEIWKEGGKGFSVMLFWANLILCYLLF